MAVSCFWFFENHGRLSSVYNPGLRSSDKAALFYRGDAESAEKDRILFKDNITTFPFVKMNGELRITLRKIFLNSNASLRGSAFKGVF